MSKIKQPGINKSQRLRLSAVLAASVVVGLGLAWAVIQAAHASAFGYAVPAWQVSDESVKLEQTAELAARQGRPVAQTDVQVTSESQSGLTLEWQLPNFKIVEREADGQPCQVIEIAGYGEAGRPGEPRLPMRGVMVGIPTTARVTPQLLDAEPIELAGRYRLCPVAEPVYEVNPDGETVYLGERERWSETAYAHNGFLPGQAVELADGGFVRSQRVASVHFAPFQYNPFTGQLRYYARLRVDLRFDGGSQATSLHAGEVDEGAFEATLQSLLLNYETARQWRTSPQSSVPAVVADITAQQVEGGSPIYKVMVDHDGIYQVTYDDLQAAGVPVASINPRTFHLTNHGAEVAIYVVGEQDGVFNPSDYLLFYGQKMNTRYTDVNVYWLTWGGVNGLRMGTLNGAPSGAIVPTYFATREHIEKNLYYLPTYPSGPDLDRWYWTLVYAVTPAVYTYTFELHDLYSTMPMSATVRGLLRGYGANPMHHTQVYLNGHLLKDDFWFGADEYFFEVQVPQTVLQEGENRIVVKAPVGPGTSYDYFFVNWFEVDYYDSFVAENDQLDFKLTANTTWEMHVDGLNSSAVEVYDITVPQSPKRVTGGVVEASGGGYQVRFQQTINGEQRYYVLTTEQWQKPLSILQDAASDLHSTANGADYLVITYDGFYDQVLPLAAYRQGRGLRTKVVKLQDVYDEFSYGVVDPQAIHDFLAYTYENWSRPAPSYVLLVGDGNYDFKNYFGYGEPSYMPPYLADVDPWLGETANENYYVSVSGSDILPDMYLGRLPVKTQGETTAMVNKIIGYEQGAIVGGWNQRVMFVADNADSAGDFAALSDAIADFYIPAPYQVQKLYYNIHYKTPAAMKSAILQGINQGALVVNFIGHAGRQWWASEQFLYYTDVGAMSNADRLPLMVPMTCLDGYFINPSLAGQDRSSLAESLVVPAGKGAIASWSPTGLGIAVGHDYLNRGLYKAFFQDYVTEIGAAATQAKYYLYSNTSSFHDLIQTYALFGDPATQLAVLRPELHLDKSANPAQVLQPGGVVTYTLVFSNSGIISATQVVISDILPAGLLTPVVSSSGAAITVRPGTSFVWDVENLYPGQGGIITITAGLTTDLPGVLTNVASIDSLNARSAMTTSATTNLYWLMYLPLVTH